jgi:hypothetical protein
MRYIITHATDSRWEAGQVPSRELVLRVGALIGDLARAGMLIDGQGLRASSLGARVKVSSAGGAATPGPFAGSNELSDGFVIVRTSSLDEAIGWAKRFGDLTGEAEIDVRPVTEPWDIGIVPRPEGHTTIRYMLLRKADRESESGRRTPEHQQALRALLTEMERADVLVTSELLGPSQKGRRFKLADGRRAVIDGPFAESKELIAGYVLIRADSLDEAAAWAPRYQDVVESPEVEVREVEE